MNAAQELYNEPTFRELFRSFEQMNMEREQKAAKADPIKHKLSRVFDQGVSAAYRYYGGKKNWKGQRVLFCYSVHRNTAGFFLGWRETYLKNGNVKRDRWVSRRIKARCIDIAKSRAGIVEVGCDGDGDRT